MNAFDYLESLKFDFEHIPELFNEDDRSFYRITELMEGYAKHREEQLRRNYYVFTPEQVGLVSGPLKRAVSSLEAIINSK